MRQIWCERMPWERFGERALTEALRTRDIAPLVAVTEPDRVHAPALVHRLRDAGLSVGLWPLLHDARRRWASVPTFAEFRDHALALVETLAARDALPDEIAIDLEPPLDRMRAALDGRPWRARPREGSAGADFPALVQALREHGVRVTAAVLPMVSLASPRAARGWQHLLGTPVDAVGYDRVNTMTYSSLYEGYSRGWLARADARALLSRDCARAVAAYGARASVSLGCVGPGSLGDERCYRSPAELADDVAIAHAAGVKDLILFELAGAEQRGLEGWLDAFVAPPASAHVGGTARARGFSAVCTAVGLVADRLHR